MVCTSQPTKIWWRTSFHAWCTHLDLPPFWITSKILLQILNYFYYELIPNFVEFIFKAHWPSGRVFINGLGDWSSIPALVIPKTRKMVFDTSCLTLSIIRYVSRVKWSNPRKGVAPYPTSRCSSYWKWSFWVTLNYSHHLYLLYFYI